MPALIAQPGMPLWVDLATTDVDAAQEFYGGLFGWSFEQVADGYDGYLIAKRDGMPVAGLARIPEGAPLWGLSLYMPDVADAHDKAVTAGAESVLPPTDNGEARGEMAVIIDPAGAAVGLKRPADEHALFAAGEPGTPVWHELLVGKNWAETAKFYHELAGWDIRQVGGDTADAEIAAGSAEPTEPRYAVGEYEGAALVGLWDTAALDGSPSMWTLTMGVANMTAAIASVTELGGAVVREPWASEFGLMATITDPAGALLNICEIGEFVPEDDVHEPDLFAPEDFRAM